LIEIDYINGLSVAETYGWARYQSEICKRLTSVRLNRIEYHRLRTPFSSHSIPYQGHINRYAIYPVIIRKHVREGNIKHITCQEFAYLLKLFEFDRAIVTCYDLIWYAYFGSRSFYWRQNIEGLTKADFIITISEFSKNEIIKYACCSASKIRVVNPGLDHSQFYVNRDKTILDKYNIPQDQKIVLYVGSEQPRQNLPTLLRAFAKLKETLPGVKFIKIGNPQWKRAREKLLALVREFNLADDVVFMQYVPEEELPLWYNCADVFLYPCLYSGWSLPCVEAMACGTPVIASNIPPLIEAVNDGGMFVDPSDVNALAASMYEVLTSTSLRQDMIDKGIKRASTFSWEKTAAETFRVYREVSV